jgi:PEP-CTERM motif
MSTRDQFSHLVRSTTIGLLFAVGVCCLLVQTASAALLYSEGFNYTADQALVPNDGWTGGSSLITVGSGNLTFPGLADLGGPNLLSVSNGAAGSTYTLFANQTSGQVYYSFLLNPLELGTGNRYLTALNPGVNPPNGGSDALSVYVYSNNTFGLRTAGASAIHTVAFSLNTTYFIVVSYDFDNTQANMWVNPTGGGAQGAADMTLAGDASVTAIDNIGFKAQSDATGAYLIDTLRVGTTWADVNPAVVPEPSSLMLAAAGIGLLVGMIRRRRS